MDLSQLDLTYDKRHAARVLELLDRCGQVESGEEDNAARALAKDASILLAKLIALEALSNATCKAMEKAIGRLLQAYETHGTEDAEIVYATTRDVHDRSVTEQINMGTMEGPPTY
jgi:hypothetical protein